ncbi:hypothetical protein HY971_02005 [Candidatus Kaiserbacteria bacterium]|nr:hypothetical protein [Candidatus Kaiserbacteria bacterium]
MEIMTMTRRGPLKRIRVVILVAVLAGALIPVAVFSNRREAEEIRFFSGVLETAQVDTTVSVRGTQYEVRGGRVTKHGIPASRSAASSALRLAYAHTLAERSPLLALAGTDTDQLDARAADLEKIQEEAADMLQELLDADAEQLSGAPLDLQKRVEAVEHVRTALYPVNFLRALASLERARLSFIRNGSYSGEREYSERLIHTIESERADAAAFRVSMLAHVGDVKDISSFTLSTTVDDIKGALNEIVSGAERSAALAESRASCISGVIHACDARDLLMTLPGNVRGPSPAREALALRRADVILSLLQDAGIVYGGGSEVVEVASSTCLSAVQGPHFFWRINPETQVQPAQQIRYVGDIFYMRPTGASTPGLFKGKIPIPLSVINPFIFYRCNEKGRDVSSVVATLYTAAFAEKHPDIAPPAREALLARKYIRDADAVSYVRDAFQDISTVPADDRRDLYELALMFRNRSAGLEIVAHEVSASMRNKLDDVKAGWNSVPDPRFLFVSESAFPSFFQMYNPSFSYGNSTLYKGVPLNKTGSNLASYFLSGAPPPRADFVTSIDNFERFHAGEYDYLLKDTKHPSAAPTD